MTEERVSNIERLKQILETEEASETLNALPTDTYVRLAKYSQKLRGTATSGGGEDTPARLAKKQLWLIEVMTRRLLQLRLSKAEREAAREVEVQPQPPQPRSSGSTTKNLLPEERYVYDVLSQLKKKEERFVKAVADGQPSFFSLLQRRETQRMTTVRISKPIGEIIGADLKRYGPFEVNDVARLPVGNAQVMIAGRQAVPVSTDDY